MNAFYVGLLDASGKNGKNGKLILALSKMQRIQNITGNLHKEAAYKHAVERIRALEYPLADIADLADTDIGARILGKIREFLTTGTIAELDRLNADPRVKSALMLSQILGVGHVKISEWQSAGIYTIGDLRVAVREKKIKLTRQQTLGLKYRKDLNTPIPRAEVKQIGDEIKQYLRRPFRYCIAGSYRRGRPQSGDVDILISCAESPLLHLGERLEQCDEWLAWIGRGEKRMTLLYRPKSSKIVRQVDILWILPESYWTALNYFTGSHEHNIYLRSIAKSMGYSLDQHALWVTTKTGRRHVALHSEQDLYLKLGVAYIPPNRRDMSIGKKYLFESEHSKVKS